MITVYKYPLEIVNEQWVEIPSCAVMLCVKMQGEQPMLWAQVDTTMPMNKHHILCRGTGHPMDVHGVYIGTCMSHEDKLVWHFFVAGYMPVEKV